MNEKKFNIAIDLNNTAICFFIFYILVSPWGYYIEGSKQRIVLLFLLLPITFFSYAARIHALHIYGYFLCHFPLFALAAICPGLSYAEHLFFLIAVLVILCIELSFRILPKPVKRSNASVILILPALFAWLVNIKLGSTFLNNQIAVLMLLSCLLYCLNLYYLNFTTYFAHTVEKSNVPITQIMNIDRKLVAGFLAISTLLMLLLSRVSTIGFFLGIKSLIVSFLKFLFSFVKSTPDSVVSDETSMDDSDMLSQFLLPDATQEEETRSSLIPAKVMHGILIVILILAVICLITFLGYQIYKRFYRNPRFKGNDKLTFISPFEKKERLVSDYPKFHDRPLRHLFFMQSNNEKIRLHFKQEILKNTTRSDLAAYTSMQLIDLTIAPQTGLIQSVKESNPEELSMLHALYDKARYSGESCTRDDYQRIKHLHL